MTRREFGRWSALALGAGVAAGADVKYPWKIGVITDEVSFDLKPVLSDFCPKYGLHWVEIRMLNLDGKKTYVSTDATQAQAKDLRKQVEDAGLKFSLLDTPVYKIALPGTKPEGLSPNDLHPVQGEYDKQLDQLRHSAAVAHTLGTNRLRVFSYLRVADPLSVMDRVADDLNKAIQVAKSEGVVLVLENEFSCNVAKGNEIAELFKRVTDRTLTLNWDPGNTYMAGEEPFPKAWNEFDHSLITHMHLKDAKGKSWAPIGSGDIDYAGQFEAVKKMNYSGTMSLETHYRNARKDLYSSSVESMDGLIKVWKTDGVLS